VSDLKRRNDVRESQPHQCRNLMADITHALKRRNAFSRRFGYRGLPGRSSETFVGSRRNFMCEETDETRVVGYIGCSRNRSGPSMRHRYDHWKTIRYATIKGRWMRLAWQAGRIRVALESGVRYLKRLFHSSQKPRILKLLRVIDIAHFRTTLSPWWFDQHSRSIWMTSLYSIRWDTRHQQ